ncbi:MAG: hypothetical protein PF495_12740 [Spirochaetales bacterium]|jgi:hypothetical protein|nr:hypothetical protein [Spirochaetales bacterium]
MCNCQCGNTIAKDPAQIPFDFAYFVKPESYAMGYDTGLFWDASWCPGGPWVHRDSIDSKNHFDDWHKGFKDGLADRLENNAHFREWWNASHRGPSIRYTEPLELEPC